MMIDRAEHPEVTKIEAWLYVNGPLSLREVFRSHYRRRRMRELPSLLVAWLLIRITGRSVLFLARTTTDTRTRFRPIQLGGKIATYGL